MLVIISVLFRVLLCGVVQAECCLVEKVHQTTFSLTEALCLGTLNLVEPKHYLRHAVFLSKKMQTWGTCESLNLYFLYLMYTEYVFRSKYFTRTKYG
jgi:hypothetical protein